MGFGPHLLVVVEVDNGQLTDPIHKLLYLDVYLFYHLLPHLITLFLSLNCLVLHDSFFLLLFLLHLSILDWTLEFL